MYKLMMIDDEEEVRQGIIQKIEWEKYGFEIIGEAENGREALDLIEKSIPDVVITDIKMPIMDGLELSSILKESFPVIKVVLLTGFDEFKYAQQAINYGIVEYVLKPVLPKDMVTLLQKLKEKIDKETTQKEGIKELKEHYAKSIPIMRDKFLTSLITSKLRKDEIEKKISTYNLNLRGNGFAIASICIDQSSIKEKNFFEDDIELIKFAVMNISEEIIKKHSLGEVFFHINCLVVITRFEKLDKENIYKRTFLVLEEIRQSVEKFLGFTVTIGMGNICCELNKLDDSFKSALSALDYRLVIGNNKVIYIDDLEPQFADGIVFDENKEKVLTTSIKFGTESEITDAIELLFKDLCDIKTSFKDYQVYLIEILAAIVKISKNLQLEMKDVLGLNYNLFVEIYQFGTIEEVKDWIKSICIKLMQDISYKRQDYSKLLLDKAKEYINNNYSDEDIGLNKVSNYLHISPSYLCMIFKKEMGDTFLNYLIRVRVEVAKDLLGSTNLKTSEIAEKIGYADPNYFSYFFKRNIGLSPREYRNTLNK